MQWRENLSTGVVEIDNQHKQLIDDINEAMRLLMANKNQISAATAPVLHLKKCFAKHFEQQEEFMNSISYQNIMQHKFEHQRMLKMLTNFEEGLYMDNISSSVSHMQAEIIQWLTKHITGADKVLAQYYNGIKH